MGTPTQPSPLKQRHGCLTVWLTLMIILNSLFSLTMLGLMYLGWHTVAPFSELRLLTFELLLLSLGGVANVACAIALFKWKKFGFYGFIATSATAFAVNIYIGLGIAPSLGVLLLLGVGMLYGVLHIGNEKAGWRQLD
jgi:hypothetical protein